MVQSSSALQEQVSLFVSGRKLKDLDTFSKSDPRCILFEKRFNQWVQVGQTERIANNLNPDFQTSFTVAYFFEKTQHFKFVMVDDDNNSGTDFDEIGSVEVTMGTLVGAPRQTWTGNLIYNGSANRGQIIVRTQSVAQSNLISKFSLSWQNVNNVAGGCMGMCSSRQFYRCQIMKEVPGDNNRFVVAATVPGEFNAANVRMPMMQIPMGALCNNDKNARIKFSLQSNRNNTIQVFQECVTSIAELESGKTALNCGNNCTALVENFEVRVKPSFVDYLRAGW